MMRDKSYVATALGPDVVEYLAWKRLGAAERTLDQYERDLRLVCLAIPEGVAGVTHSHLQQVLSVVPEGSRKRVRAAWSDFFKWAVRDGRRLDNPVDRLPRLRPTPEPEYDLWSQRELDLLVAGTRQLEHPRIEALRVLTMIESGGRAGELRGLQLGHFDLMRKTVTVIGKGSKKRLVPISGELARLVDEHFFVPYPERPQREPLPSDYVWFPTRRDRSGALTFLPDRPVQYGAFHAWWRRVEEAAGVRHRRPHMTRHTFATDALDGSGGNIYGVKELLGHSKVATTETYLHSGKHQAETAFEAMLELRQRRREVADPA